nr:unnamed protein product [Digitaria exilis]
MLFFLLMAAASPTSSNRQALGHHHGSCLPHERDALLAFKQGITSDPSGRLASWDEGKEQDCCKWRGIRCSNQTNRVIAIQLRNTPPDGDLKRHPAWETALAGQISPSLISLQHLERLDLSENDISGPAGRVPEFLGLLKNLRYLNLSGMTFTGEVPPQLGNLSKLHYLDLSRPNLFAPVLLGTSLYSTDISWLSNLPLHYIDMSSVDLSRIVDWAHVVNMLDTLYAQNPLMYDGNIGLCGYPLQKNCNGSGEPKHSDLKRDGQDSKVLTLSFGLGLGCYMGEMDKNDTAAAAAAALSSSSSPTGHGVSLLQGGRANNGTAGTISCWPHERDALLEFKRGITSDPAEILTSWQPGEHQDCCRWRGIRCSSKNSHVISVHLRNVGANDAINWDAGDTALVGQISPSLLSLQHLKHLDLSLNQLEVP